MCVWCVGDKFDPSVEWDKEDTVYDLDNGDIPETDDEVDELLKGDFWSQGDPYQDGMYEPDEDRNTD